MGCQAPVISVAFVFFCMLLTGQLCHAQYLSQFQYLLLKICLHMCWAHLEQHNGPKQETLLTHKNLNKGEMPVWGRFTGYHYWYLLWYSLLLCLNQMHVAYYIWQNHMSKAHSFLLPLGNPSRADEHFIRVSSILCWLGTVTPSVCWKWPLWRGGPAHSRDVPHNSIVY